MRRVFRVHDNTPLSAALQDADIVIPVLCLRTDDKYRTNSPRRRYVRSAITSLDAQLRSLGSQLVVCRGVPEIELPKLASELKAEAIYAARTYDPIARKRDRKIQEGLKNAGRELVTFKDSVLFEEDEILNQAKLPFRVFTPYKRTWLERANDIAPVLSPLRSLPPLEFSKRFDLSLVDGFSDTHVDNSEPEARKQLLAFIKNKASSYRTQRDYPAVEGTSRLSAALSLGVISIRSVYWVALEGKRNADKHGRENIDTFISELIWREFYYQILSNFPFVTERSFKEDLATLQWSVNKVHFRAWCEGRTGYPIVDAGMRQLAQEGWMHNRVRMIVASFLTKDLHISWQWGEKFFFDHLCDADIASNNGGWQWSAGTGTDAQPWFRIFNPVSQGERFDPDGTYVRTFVPELATVPTKRIHAPWKMDKQEQSVCGVTIGKQYPSPIVDHATEREVTMHLYKHEPTKKRRQEQGQLELI